MSEYEIYIIIRRGLQHQWKHDQRKLKERRTHAMVSKAFDDTTFVQFLLGKVDLI